MAVYVRHNLSIHYIKEAINMELIHNYSALEIIMLEEGIISIMIITIIILFEYVL